MDINKNFFMKFKLILLNLSNIFLDIPFYLFIKNHILFKF